MMIESYPDFYTLQDVIAIERSRQNLRECLTDLALEVDGITRVIALLERAGARA